MQNPWGNKIEIAFFRQLLELSSLDAGVNRKQILHWL